MAKRYYKQDSEFNVGIVRELLLEVTVPPETAARLGVPAPQLRQWLRELAASLGEGGQPSPPERKHAYANPARQCGKLSDGEIHFLLEGFAGKPPAIDKSRVKRGMK